ncbi:MAG TPA: hypothetical protein PL004_11965 [Bacillota bacterium]|nr:hypothetical protein [Bacillota bacterium]
MSKIHPAIQNSLLQMLRYYIPFISTYQGVHYVDVGYKYTGGQRLSTLAIRVHVHQKQPLHSLTPSQILPENLDHIPVDVIESHPEMQQRSHIERRNIRFDPLIGGVAIRNPRFRSMGTLGKIVFDNETGQPLGLTNYHVLVGDSGQLGDAVTQPASGLKEDIIGHLLRCDETCDCAVFTLNHSRQWSPDILDLDFHPPTGPGEPLIGMEVSKSGLTTGITQGLIDGVSLDEFTVVPLETDPQNFQELSAPGDSGSIWIETETGIAVGLHYAGEVDPDPAAERAWSKKLTDVCSALNIHL